MLVSGGSVFAVGNPSGVTIGDVYVWDNFSETDDQLYFCRYDVNYASTPTEYAEDTWEMALYDSTGALVATRPLNYYQHNIISIYLDSSDALVWASAAQIIIRGMPSIFPNLTEDVNMETRTLAPGDWHHSTADDMGTILVHQAEILEADWGITLLGSSDKLNTTGRTYFLDAVPGLESACPEIFETAYMLPGVTNPEWSENYAIGLVANESASLRNIGGTLAGMFGTTEGWADMFLVFMVYLLTASIMLPGVREPSKALMAAFPIVVLCCWLGMGLELLRVVLVLVFILGVLFAINYILPKFG